MELQAIGSSYPSDLQGELMFVVVILACSALAVVLTLVLVREARRRMALESLLRRLFPMGGSVRNTLLLRADDSRHRPGDRLPE